MQSLCDQGFGADHLRALTAMPQLEVLNLYHVKWTADAAAMGLPWLADGLPRLRVLNAPDYVLVRPQLLPLMTCCRRPRHSADTAAGSCGTCDVLVPWLPTVSSVHLSAAMLVPRALSTFTPDTPGELLQAQGVTELDGCSYRLRGCCGRRLRRWPKRATLGKAAGDPLRRPWPVLESHRWLWE